MGQEAEDENAISSPGDAECEYCGRWKSCRLYLIPTGEAAYVCKDCRTGRGKVA